MIINQIAQGFYNSLLNREEELYQDRIKVCRCCELLKIDEIFGETCKSCGCILRSKCRVKDAECPKGK